ncbi:hypothetical protein D9M69_494500 [compost metagenome]
MILERRKVFRRSFASLMLSPCPRRFRLQSSGSSTATRGTGVDFTLAGLFEPTNLRKPPGNFLKSCRCCSLRLRRSTFFFNRGVASIIGSNFSATYCLAASALGNSTRIGDGSMSIHLPRALPSTPEVQATWADLRQTISLTFGSSSASSGPPGHTRCGVTWKRYLPGRAASSGASHRYFSAHSMIVILGGGAHFLAARRMALIAVLFSCLRIVRLVSVPG